MTPETMFELIKDNIDYDTPDNFIPEELFHEFNVHESYAEQDKLVMFNVATWICTDTRVGLYAVTHCGDIVGAAFKPYRKSDMKFYWRNEEVAEAVRVYLLSLPEQYPQKHKSILELFEDKEMLFVDDGIAVHSTYGLSDHAKEVITTKVVLRTWDKSDER